MFIEHWGSPQDPNSEYSQNCERLQDGLDAHGVMKCTQGLIHPDGEYEEIAAKVAEAAEWKQNHSDWLSEYEQDVFLRSWTKHDYDARCSLLQNGFDVYGVMRCTDSLIHPQGKYEELQAARAQEAAEWANHHSWWHYKWGQDVTLASWGSPEDPDSGYTTNCGYLLDGFNVYGAMECTNGLIHPDGAYEQTAAAFGRGGQPL